MTILNGQGIDLLRLLVSLLPNADPEKPNKMIGYKEAHERLGLYNIRGDWGDSLKAQGLENLAEWTKSNRKPAITGLIVNKSDLSPGKGYYSLFDREDMDYQWWREQITASKNYDWTPDLKLASVIDEIEPPMAPIAIDMDVPTDREDITVSRVIRDTRIARKVKNLHDFACQICGISITLSNGSKYAEAHHIQPLGKPHNGPDRLENVMCLCPNHHVEMDYGVFSIVIEEIRFVAGHSIDPKFIEYHNNIVRPKFGGNVTV